jgi:hypothetical protein
MTIADDFAKVLVALAAHPLEVARLAERGWLILRVGMDSETFPNVEIEEASGDEGRAAARHRKQRQRERESLASHDVTLSRRDMSRSKSVTSSVTKRDMSRSQNGIPALAPRASDPLFSADSMEEEQKEDGREEEQRSEGEEEKKAESVTSSVTCHVTKRDKERDVTRDTSSSPSELKKRSHTEEVFETYLEGWRENIGRGASPALTEPRRKLIAARLKDHGLETVRRAAQGCWRDEYHLKGDGKPWQWMKPELVFRDAQHVEKFALLGDEPVHIPRNPPPDIIRPAWMPPIPDHLKRAGE